MNALARPREFRPRGGDAAPALALGGIAVRGRIAVLDMERPAPCFWDLEEQQLFADALVELGARPDVQVVILSGAALFDDRADGSRHDFREVIDAVTECGAPVIAAISGDAIGAGLELALACAGRICRPDSRFALPDLAAGRLATHGAVERLPGLIGMTRAAEMIVFGQAMDAGAAAACGLVDAVEYDDLISAARDLPERPSPRAVRRDGVDAESATAELFSFRLRLRRQAPDQTAPLAALQALETALRLPLRRAMAETSRLAEALSRSDQARALAYARAGATALSAWGQGQALARRLRWPLLREAVHLLDEGATPAQVDRCLTAFGFAEGPFAESDRLGMGTVFLGAPDLTGPGPWLSYSPTLDLMVDAQRMGGDAPGWFREGDPGNGPRAYDPAVAHLLQGSATFQRLSRQSISDDGVADRCLLAAVNGSAEILQDRTDLTPALVDAVWTTMLGFPAWKGGPLRCADAMGLDKVTDGLNALHARRATAGPPCEIIRRRAARGEGFA